MHDTQVNKIDYKNEVCRLLMELPQLKYHRSEIGFRWCANMARALTNSMNLFGVIEVKSGSDGLHIRPEQ